MSHFIGWRALWGVAVFVAITSQTADAVGRSTCFLFLETSSCLGRLLFYGPRGDNSTLCSFDSFNSAKLAKLLSLGRLKISPVARIQTRSFIYSIFPIEYNVNYFSNLSPLLF